MGCFYIRAAQRPPLSLTIHRTPRAARISRCPADRAPIWFHRMRYALGLPFVWVNFALQQVELAWIDLPNFQVLTASFSTKNLHFLPGLWSGISISRSGIFRIRSRKLSVGGDLGGGLFSAVISYHIILYHIILY